MKKLLLITALILSVPTAAIAANLNSQLRQAQKDIKNNKLEDALKTLLDAQIDAPENALLDYHLGQVYYRMERYQEAATAFGRALRTDDKSLRADSTYALGNTAFKQGQLKEAIEFYSQAVEMRPEDEDAKYNLDLAREELRRLLEEQKKQQQQQQQQQEQQENQQCNNPQPADGNSDSQSQSQNSQDKQQDQSDNQNEQQSQQQQETAEEQPSPTDEENQEGDQQQQQQQAGAADQNQQEDQEQQEDQKAGAGEERDSAPQTEEQPVAQQAREDAANETEEQQGRYEAEQALRRLQEQPPAPKMEGRGRRRVTKDW